MQTRFYLNLICFYLTHFILINSFKEITNQQIVIDLADWVL